MKAVILAAGEGKRLRPLTNKLPKILLPIREDGWTILDHLISSFPTIVNEIFIIVSSHQEKIRDRITKKWPKRQIILLEQTEKTGTMGAVLLVENFIKSNESFFVIHGDDYHLSEDIKNFIHKTTYGISLARKVYNPQYYSFDIDKNGYILGTREQTELEKKNGALIASGMYMLTKEVFSFPRRILFNKEIGLPQTILNMKDVHPLQCYIEKEWYPVNTIDDLKKLQTFLKKKGGEEISLS